jgi:hypothetical protein
VNRMWLLIGAGWAVLAWVVVRLIGRGIRLADVREGLVPQLDDPLRRGTDLQPPGVCAAPRCECATPCPSAPDRPELPGAILALAYATDETSARYWLAVCARRGATPTELDALWTTWQRQHLPTDRDEDQ